jgi:hypothetical protein
MSQRKSSRVLRAAIVIEDKLCGELHQTEPGSLKVGWGLDNDLVVHDAVDRRRDPKKLAKPLLMLGILMVLAGIGLFATDLNRYSQEEAARQEVLQGETSFDVYDYGSASEGPDVALIGLTLLLLGLAPLVAGLAGVRAPELNPRKSRSKKTKRVAPESVTLFEYRDGRYFLNLPNEARGKVTLAKGKRAYTVKQLRRKQGSARVQVALRSTAKGKILLGNSIVLFQFARPKRKPPALRPLKGFGLSGTPLPLAYAMLVGIVGLFVAIGFLLGPIGIVGCLAVGATVNFVLQRQREPLFAAILLGSVLIFGTGGMYIAFGVQRSTEVKIDARMIEAMGIVYEQEDKPPEPEEEEEEEEPEEEELKQPEESEPKKQVEPDKVVKTKPKKFSEEATKKARGVGVARVLGTYGGPGEGTVFDVIESTENNLDSLFDKGMGRVVDADGTEVSDFVAGGEGITASGALVGTEGLKTTDDQPNVEKKKKREKKIKGKVKSSTSEVYGDVDKKLVQATIRRRMGGLQSCYEKSLRSQAGLKGKISFTITISTSGRVVKVSVEGDTLGDGATLSCCKSKIKGWRFPVEGAEDSSEVTFSVVFSQAS